jgi:hypothetical protein
MTTLNRTTYICGICNTNPDQLSHHTAHLNSKTHQEQQIICEYNVRRYVVDFLYLVNDNYWGIYLQNEYLDERMRTESIPIFEDWIVKKSYDIEKKYNLKNNCSECYVSKYEAETHKKCDLKDEIDKIIFLDWKIMYLIKQAETIQKTERSLKHFDNEMIHKINNNEITIDELFNNYVNCFCFDDNNDNYNDRRAKIIKNNINLGYIVYSNFKNKFCFKFVDIVTIILDQTETRKRPYWFIKDEDLTCDKSHQIKKLIIDFIQNLLNNVEEENEKITKIKNNFLLGQKNFSLIILQELFK